MSATAAILRIRGDVDGFAAADLGALIDAVIGRSRRRLIIDLADVALIDPTAAEVIAAAAHRLGARLVIMAPNAAVRHTLTAVGVTRHVRRAPSSDDHLGVEQTVARPGSPVTSASPDSLHSRDVRRVMAVPSDDDVVDGALRLVVGLATRTVRAADGVSVSLRRHGRLTTVAASDKTISDMDAYQYGTGQGPCVDASVEGRWFHVESLAAEARWPTFTPKAGALGINAILSSPLLVRDRPVGALNIYSRRAGAFAPDDQELAAVFATEASAILAAAAVDATQEEVAAALAQALRSRQIIAQAQGVLMARHHIPAERAYAALRRLSAETGTPLVQHAEAVVSSTHPPVSSHPQQGDHDAR